MTPREATSHLMCAVGTKGIYTALESALDGGPAVAPLPSGRTEVATTIAMLQAGRPVTEPDAAAIVSTSGSTGTPKGVVLSRAAIVASATATHQRLGGPGSWTLALPEHYVAGLMVLARSIVAGNTPQLVRRDLSDLTVPSSSGRHYLSLVPAQLSRALAPADRYRDARLASVLACFDAILLGGAAADPQLLDRAAAQGIRVVTTYGMSETCGGCVYDGRPLDGVSVSCEDGTGRILLSGPMVFSGYRLRADLTADVLTPTTTSGSDSPWRTLRTYDRGTLDAGLLRVHGRLDDVVISGGLNVDLTEVERLARAVLWDSSQAQLPGGDLAIVDVPDPVWGVRLVAVTDADTDLATLQGWLRPQLPGNALPRDLVRVPVLPRTSSGKIDRQRLQCLVSTSSTDGSETPGQHHLQSLVSTSSTDGSETPGQHHLQTPVEPVETSFGSGVGAAGTAEENQFGPDRDKTMR